MRIALISGEYPPAPGGVGDYTAQLAHVLQARGGDVVVITRQVAVQGQSSDECMPATHAPLVMRLPTEWGWEAWHKLRQALQLIEPEIVHIQYQTGAYGQHPAINLLPAYLHQRLRLPVVVTAHDLLLPYLFPKADLLRRWVMRRLLQEADAVIVTNAEDQDRLRGTVAGDRQHAADQQLACHLIPIGSNIMPQIPDGFDCDTWRAAHGLQDKQVIGYFGLMSPSKGVLELVQALPHLKPSVQLLIIGGAATTSQEQAYAAEVRALIAKLGLAARVQWTGHCTTEAVSAFLLTCDVVALPFTDGASYRRGSLLAALAHGCPTVTTQPRTQLVPAFDDGVAARLLPDLAPATLAATLGAVLNDAGLRQQLRVGGRAVAEHFGWSEIAAAHEVVYNGVYSLGKLC